MAINAEADIQAACSCGAATGGNVGILRAAAYHIAMASKNWLPMCSFHGGGGWLHAQALFDAQTQQALGLEVLALDHGRGLLILRWR